MCRGSNPWLSSFLCDRCRGVREVEGAQGNRVSEYLSVAEAYRDEGKDQARHSVAVGGGSVLRETGELERHAAPDHRKTAAIDELKRRRRLDWGLSRRWPFGGIGWGWMSISGVAIRLRLSSLVAIGGPSQC